ncbi:hypothetical protein CF651_04715 [Paenibacillus rigui]|uniref:Uncharacterized protein n=1 Tax=Paenibacillus rigui TaxID=554312 RepID=A0A229UVG6_9BACL|nr:hypothetical protein CF651_04715 [Paenibacillus rigui]
MKTIGIVAVQPAPLIRFRYQGFFIELGPTYYEERKRDVIIKHSIKKLESLGVSITVNTSAS